MSGQIKNERWELVMLITIHLTRFYQNFARNFFNEFNYTRNRVIGIVCPCVTTIVMNCRPWPSANSKDTFIFLIEIQLEFGQIWLYFSLFSGNRRSTQFSEHTVYKDRTGSCLSTSQEMQLLGCRILTVSYSSFQ